MEEREATHSPQTVAFLTAAEAVMAAEAQNEDHESYFKILVLSSSDMFPVARDVKQYFVNASVEINAMDLNEHGSSELKDTVTSPALEHYFYKPALNDRKIIKNICSNLLKGKLFVITHCIFYTKHPGEVGLLTRGAI